MFVACKSFMWSKHVDKYDVRDKDRIEEVNKILERIRTRLSKVEDIRIEDYPDGGWQLTFPREINIRWHPKPPEHYENPNDFTPFLIFIRNINERNELIQQIYRILNQGVEKAPDLFKHQKYESHLPV